MTIPNANVAGSPGWWLQRLYAKLTVRRSELDKLYRYWEGNHDLPEGDNRAREMFQAFQKKARTNYTGMLVEAFAEQLKIVGFQSGAEGDESTDSEAWRIHQANCLDADAYLVHSTALALRESYVIVGANPDDKTTPIITPEDPRFVIAEFDPIQRRKPRAGLKTYIDEVARKRFAVLMLPDEVHYFESPISDLTPRPESATDAGIDWNYISDGTEKVESNPVGEPQLVRFVNRPRMNGHGRSLLDNGAIDIQDRINDTVLNRLVIQKVQAYRQRWVKGVKMEDEDGNESDLPFVPGVDLLWAVEDENAQFGDFDIADVGPLLEAVKEDLTAFVIVTALPPQYVAGNIVNAAADAIVAVTDRFNTSVVNTQVNFGESWEQVYRLAAKTAGAQLSDDIEILWEDPERASLAQKADAALKYASAGVPWRERMRVLTFSPQEIDRMETERLNDAMMGMLAAPPQAPTTPAEPAPPVTGG